MRQHLAVGMTSAGAAVAVVPWSPAAAVVVGGVLLFLLSLMLLIDWPVRPDDDGGS